MEFTNVNFVNFLAIDARIKHRFVQVAEVHHIKLFVILKLILIKLQKMQRKAYVVIFQTA